MLDQQQAGGPETAVVDELCIKHGKFRVDLAVVGDRLEGYEIKSDPDSLRRLPDQAKHFSLVFHRMTLVVGPGHLSQALPLIPKWWGIMLATQTAHGAEISQLRPALENPKPNYRWIVRLLWRKELSELLKAHGHGRGAYKLKYYAVANRMLEVFTPEAMTAMVCEKLREREAWAPGRATVGGGLAEGEDGWVEIGPPDEAGWGLYDPL